MGGIGKGEETKNLNEVLTVVGANIVILTWQKPLWEGD
jgi:hypothetical protein